MPASTVTYTGHVQGVGFRYSVKQIAAGFEVCGTVQNLEDGSVKLLAQAFDAEELQAFLEAIDNSHLRGHIERRQIEALPMQKGLRGFQIVK